MKLILLAISVLTFTMVFAQSPADILKTQRNPMLQREAFSSLQNRDNEIGSTCATAIPVIASTFTFAATQNVENAEFGPFYDCLNTQPNPTWFHIRVQDTVQVQIVMSSETQAGFGVDIDFILYGIQPGLQCTGVYYSANLMGCSYSPANTEQTFAGFMPEWDYYLLITNFSNQPNDITINFTPTSGELNFVVDGSYIFNGSIYADVDSDCTNNNEPAISSGSVSALGTILTVPVQPDGSFTMALPSYSNQLFTYNNNFPLLAPSLNCNNEPVSWSYNADIPGTYSTEVGISSPECSLPLVQTHKIFSRRCFSNARTIQYGNWGPDTLFNATIQLQYDVNEVIPVSIPFPYTESDGTFTLEIGDVLPFQTASFYVIDSLTCENGLNSTVVVTARISPVPDCIAVPVNWDQSDVFVTGKCSGGTIEFEIINEGAGNMSEPVVAELYANEVLIEQISVQLESNANQQISFPSESNTTYVLVIPETANHPFNTSAWAAAECYTSEVFTGSIPSYQPQDQQPWLDQDIQRVIGAYDPNDKNAIPFGATTEHYIDETDELEYLIRFQNTGNDTAFNILVVDLLPPELDYSTFRFIGASHAYNYQLIDNELSVQFPNIQLPDSATNEDASMGYFVFKINQREDNPSVYEINNSAAIYFDFNAPIITNVCTRRVGDFVLIENKVNSESLILFPNPSETSITIKNLQIQDNSHIEIYDITGRSVMNLSLNASQTIDIQTLPSGMYIIQLLDDKTIYQGRFIRK